MENGRILRVAKRCSVIFHRFVLEEKGFLERMPNIETFFIEIKILLSVDSGPKIHTRMSEELSKEPPHDT